MYAMKIEDLKGRGKVRTHSGLFSMGALAIALSACGGGTFELAEKDAVTLKDGVVSVTFKETPKTVSATLADYKAVGATLTAVKGNGKAIEFTFSDTANSIKITLVKADAVKDNNDKDYALSLDIDNQLPSLESASADAKVVKAVFSEKITAADATKFTIGSKVATAAVVDTADTSGKTVTVTFADDASGTLTLAAGAVTDDAASKSNTEGLQSAVDATGKSLGASADAAPAFANETEAKDVAENTTVVDTYAATDADGDTIAYTLSGDDSALFAVSAAGALSFKSAPDYENAGDVGTNNVYDVTITATAGGKTDTVAVAVTVTNDTTETGGSADDDLIGLSLGSSDADYGF